jgi:hypothetical protein
MQPTLTKYFGEEYENKLIFLIIGSKTETTRDSKFGLKILSILEKDYFSTSFAQEIVAHIISYHKNYKSVPFYDEIKGLINTSAKKDSEKKALLSFLREIFYTKVTEEKQYVKESASFFFMQQRLYKAIKESEKIILNGEVSKYPECERLIKDALKENDVDENHYITDEVDELDFSDEIKEYVKLGWGEGIESYLANGSGLRVGKAHAVFAPSGGGKTTGSIVTLSNAYLAGHDVVQILFEDSIDDIKDFQKAHWSGLSKNNITKINSGLIIDESNQKIRRAKEKGGNWIVKRFRSHHTTIDEIENYIIKITDVGYNPKLITLDYLECIQSKRKYKEDWMGELEIMTDFDYLASKDAYNFCGLIYFQGNRSAQIAEILDERHLGGNFKKFQPCHTVLAVAPISKIGMKDKANISLLKNRSGQARLVFKEGTWDRGKVRINFKTDTYAGGIDDFLDDK